MKCCPPIHQSYKRNDLGVNQLKVDFLVRVCEGDVEGEVVGESMVVIRGN